MSKMIQVHPQLWNQTREKVDSLRRERDALLRVVEVFTDTFNRDDIHAIRGLAECYEEYDAYRAEYGGQDE